MNDTTASGTAVLVYRELLLQLQFADSFRNPATTLRFALRNSIGRELRSMVCYWPERLCSVCELKQTCAYGVVFHSDTGNGVRDIHPYALSLRAHPTERSTANLRVRVFSEHGDRYLPYLYYSVVRAGMYGVSAGNGFSIRRAWLDGQEFEASDDEFQLTGAGLRLHLPADGMMRNPIMDIRVQTCSPLRIKAQGRFLKAMDWREFWFACARRVDQAFTRFAIEGQSALTVLHGLSIPEVEEESSAFEWIDSPYLSRSQGARMQLGGLVGELSVKVRLTATHRAVLEAASVLQVGKNTSFGLGDIEVLLDDQKGAARE